MGISILIYCSSNYEIKMADKVNVCWLFGGYFQRQQVIDKIVQSLTEAKVVRIPEEASGEDVSDLLKRSDEGIFNDEVQNKVVILSHIPSFKSVKQSGRLWSKLVKECPENIILVFNNIPKTESSSLFKLVKKIGKVFDYNDKISTSEAIEISEHYLKQEGKKIDPEYIKLFIDRIKDDKKIESDLVYSSLIKLCAYLGKDKTITQEHILNAVNKNTKFVVWDWFELMDKKDFHSLMVNMSELKKNEKISNILSSLLPVLRWRFKLILLTKEQKIISKDSNKVLKELAKIKKANKNGELKQAYSDYSIRGLLFGKPGVTAPIDTYTRGQLISMLKLIDNFILKTRYGANECQSEMMLEVLFMFVCQHNDVSVIKDIRKYLIER